MTYLTADSWYATTLGAMYSTAAQFWGKSETAHTCSQMLTTRKSSCFHLSFLKQILAEDKKPQTQKHIRENKVELIKAILVFCKFIGSSSIFHF